MRKSPAFAGLFRRAEQDGDRTYRHPADDVKLCKGSSAIRVLL